MRKLYRIAKEAILLFAAYQIAEIGLNYTESIPSRINIINYEKKISTLENKTEKSEKMEKLIKKINKEKEKINKIKDKTLYERIKESYYEIDRENKSEPIKEGSSHSTSKSQLSHPS